MVVACHNQEKKNQNEIKQSYIFKQRCVANKHYKYVELTLETASMQPPHDRREHSIEASLRNIESKRRA
jgi:hypothetical protein